MVAYTFLAAVIALAVITVVFARRVAVVRKEEYDHGLNDGKVLQRYRDGILPDIPTRRNEFVMQCDAYCHEAADLLETFADLIDSRTLRYAGRLNRKIKAREEALSVTAIDRAHQLRKVGLAPRLSTLRQTLHDNAAAAGDPSYCVPLTEGARIPTADRTGK